jgi:hypothetical protein
MIIPIQVFINPNTKETQVDALDNKELSSCKDGLGATNLLWADLN